MLHQYIRRRHHLTIWLVLLVVFGLGLLDPRAALAGLRSCRADPLVWLSNGQMVRMTSEVAAPANEVAEIVYTLHAPIGTTVTKVVYTGGALQEKERVVVIADNPPGLYTTDTVVKTTGPNVQVTANSSLGPVRGSATGMSHQHLILQLKASR